jgi:hypothetical protein
MSMPLTPAQWQRLEELYHSALAVSPEDRQELLDRACAGDSELRRAIDELIDSDSQTAGFLDGSPAQPALEELARLIERSRWEDEDG